MIYKGHDIIIHHGIVTAFKGDFGVYRSDDYPPAAAIGKVKLWIDRQAKPKKETIGISSELDNPDRLKMEITEVAEEHTKPNQQEVVDLHDKVALILNKMGLETKICEHWPTLIVNDIEIRWEISLYEKRVTMSWRLDNWTETGDFILPQIRVDTDLGFYDPPEKHAKLIKSLLTWMPWLDSCINHHGDIRRCTEDWRKWP